MHSFLFPENIDRPSPYPFQQPVLSLEKATVPTTTTAPPPMPTRAPPAAPQQRVSPSVPSPPARAPPPIPMTKEEPAISVVELHVSSHEPHPELRRAKSKRQIISLSLIRSKREPRAEKTPTKAVVALPPLSPIVDDDFWETGRYPSSPQNFMMAHVPF